MRLCCYSAGCFFIGISAFVCAVIYPQAWALWLLGGFALGAGTVMALVNGQDQE